MKKAKVPSPPMNLLYVKSNLLAIDPEKRQTLKVCLPDECQSQMEKGLLFVTKVCGGNL